MKKALVADVLWMRLSHVLEQNIEETIKKNSVGFEILTPKIQNTLIKFYSIIYNPIML